MGTIPECCAQHPAESSKNSSCRVIFISLLTGCGAPGRAQDGTGDQSLAQHPGRGHEPGTASSAGGGVSRAPKTHPGHGCCCCCQANPCPGPECERGWAGGKLLGLSVGTAGRKEPLGQQGEGREGSGHWAGGDRGKKLAGTAGRVGRQSQEGLEGEFDLVRIAVGEGGGGVRRGCAELPREGAEQGQRKPTAAAGAPWGGPAAGLWGTAAGVPRLEQEPAPCQQQQPEVLLCRELLRCPKQ